MSALVPAKITAQHLERTAYVYVRQSTMTQVHEHLENQRRQYALAEHARTWGWQQVEVVDDDLGRSGSGRTARPGFERLVAAVCDEPWGRCSPSRRRASRAIIVTGITSSISAGSPPRC